jgi:hypothetical protein
MRPGSAGCRLTCRLAVTTVAGHGLAEPGICGHCLPVWLPTISLATLMFEFLRPDADLRASPASGPIRLSQTALVARLGSAGHVPAGGSVVQA